MSDPGTRATARAVKALEERLRKAYGDAKAAVEKKIRAYTARWKAKDVLMRAAEAAGEITEKEYREWLARTVFRGKQWDAVVKHCTDIMADANRQALNIIRGRQIDVFAENATYQAYELEHGLGASYGFGVYSRETVGKLLQDEPELLPRKVLNGVKDEAWNQQKIAGIISQSIIRGDGIDTIAATMGEQLASTNDKAMMRYARTAMTAAQNAGRVEMLHDAEEEGIHSKKKWLATLDSRTRDAHQELDGQTAEIDEPFHSELGDIMYPGDPNAEPGNVYNCRCTLVYEIDGHPSGGQRRAYTEWDDEDGHHRESCLVGNMTYREWKEWKER